MSYEKRNPWTLLLLVVSVGILKTGGALSAAPSAIFEDGWQEHDQLGWIYVYPDPSESGDWLWYQSGGDWLYTSESLYPLMYQLSTTHWLYYYEGSSHWFYDFISKDNIRLSSAERPNVLLVMTDDQGYGDVALHGNPYLETPNMDLLGEEGIQAENFYVHPVCAPTRASLLTGRYHLRTGARSTVSRLEVVNPNEVTIAEVFKGNGYATGAFGKWHSGAFYPENPNGQGFDEYLGCVDSLLLDYFDPVLHHNDEMLETEGYITDILTDAAIDFIHGSQTQDKPFFCYMPLNAPHMPILAPNELTQKYLTKRLDLQTAGIYGMIESIDINLGRLLETLSNSGLTEDTIVIFMTDNGANTDRFNAGLSGRKGSFSEGGMRVPFYLRWPAKFPDGGMVSKRLAHIDILPTLAELCGLEGWEDLELDGRSFASLLENPESEWENRYLYGFNWGKREALLYKGSIRDDRYLGLLNKSKWSLYDLIEDPYQKTNLAGSKPQVVAELQAAFEAMADEVRIPWDPTPIPIGYAGWESVLVESHDCLLMGNGIGNSYGYGNNFIKDWTSTAAYPEWPLDFVNGGTYEVTVAYALKPGCEGVRHRLEIGDIDLDFQINEAHYPANNPVPYIIDSEKDKYAAKPWKTLSLGNIVIPEGETIMRLKMISRPGQEGIEFKEVELKRID